MFETCLVHFQMLHINFGATQVSFSWHCLLAHHEAATDGAHGADWDHKWQHG
jgi:hypothetical protein